MTACRTVKIFGERNTSTNALKQLIERNSRSVVAPSIAKDLDPLFSERMAVIKARPDYSRAREDYLDSVFRDARPLHSWKHAATTFSTADDFAECLIIFTVRHAASWLLALHRQPYHALQPVPDTFAEFISAPWTTTERERLNGETYTPMTLYNTKIASYRALAGRLAARGIEHRFVRFEDFACGQTAVFAGLKTSLHEPADVPAILRHSTKEGGQDPRFYRDYYGEEKWRDELSSTTREMINDKIDWKFAEEFGYRAL